MIEHHNMLDIIGDNSPFILMVITFYLLRKHKNFLFYYVIGILIDRLLNILLKGLILQPRPSEDPSLFNLAIKNGKRFIFKNSIIPYDICGMPSEHTQSAIFSTVFIYLSLKNSYISLSYLIISLITMYQRVLRNHHTIFQVIMGDIVGGLFAIVMFYFAKQNIKGVIKIKSDDNAPI
jgi:membrane-associated phospholipid phosphatase